MDASVGSIPLARDAGEEGLIIGMDSPSSAVVGFPYCRSCQDRGEPRGMNRPGSGSRVRPSLDREGAPTHLERDQRPLGAPAPQEMAVVLLLCG